MNKAQEKILLAKMEKLGIKAYVTSEAYVVRLASGVVAKYTEEKEAVKFLKRKCSL